VDAAFNEPLKLALVATVMDVTSKWRVKRVFRRLDIDSDGAIGKEELTWLLKKLDAGLESDQVDALLAAVDKNQDGAVQLDEFLDWAFQDGNDTLFKSHFYICEGTKYDELEEFLQAAGKRASAAPVILEDQVREHSSKLFKAYAGDDGLTLQKVSKYLASLAAELGLDPRCLGNARKMFWRFDVTGTASLDQEASCHLAMAAVTHYVSWRKPTSSGKAMEIQSKDLDELFEVSKKLGAGGQGVVYEAKEKATGKDRVVKFVKKKVRKRVKVKEAAEDISKADDKAKEKADDGEDEKRARRSSKPLWEDKTVSSVNIDAIKYEFQLLQRLDHPNVQRVFDIFDDQNNIYIVGEPYSGGSLVNLVPRAEAAGQRVTNKWLGHVLQQVAQGVAYLHSQHIMHCDLKPQNSMIANSGSWDDPAIVVIDFGLASHFAHGKKGGGTLGFRPPEISIDNIWTPQGDVFAFGVMMYRFFTGHDPHGIEGQMAMDAAQELLISEVPNTEQLSKYGNLPTLVSSMLAKDFRMRPRMADILRAPFFAGLKDIQVEDLAADLLTKLCSMGRLDELQATLLVDLAVQENLAQLRELNRWFRWLDVDSDGTVSADEVRSRLALMLPAEKLEVALEGLLGHGDHVGYTSFMSRMLLAMEADVERVLRREFRTLDVDNSGLLSEEEASALLARPALAFVLGDEGAPAIMAWMERDGDGMISFEEFSAALCGEKAAATQDLWRAGQDQMPPSHSMELAEEAEVPPAYHESQLLQTVEVEWDEEAKAKAREKTKRQEEKAKAAGH